jgi:hypothetical protein
VVDKVTTVDSSGSSVNSIDEVNKGPKKDE